jgi:hypothetical protein
LERVQRLLWKLHRLDIISFAGIYEVSGGYRVYAEPHRSVSFDILDWVHHDLNEIEEAVKEYYADAKVKQKRVDTWDSVKAVYNFLHTGWTLLVWVITTTVFLTGFALAQQLGIIEELMSEWLPSGFPF